MGTDTSGIFDYVPLYRNTGMAIRLTRHRQRNRRRSLMKCTPELLEKIKEAIESVVYGSVTINLAEHGNFVGIKTYLTKPRVSLFSISVNLDE